MRIVLLLPVLLSAMLAAAHFCRSGIVALALLSFLLPGLLFYRKPISVRIMQVFLVLAAAEWGRTLLKFIQVYQDNGLSWHRLAVILGSVLICTAASALVFRSKTLRSHYNMTEE